MVLFIYSNIFWLFYNFILRIEEEGRDKARFLFRIERSWEFFKELLGFYVCFRKDRYEEG